MHQGIYRVCVYVLLLFTACVGRSVAQLTVRGITATGTADTAYTWSLTKQLQPPTTLSIPLGGTATANYQITVSRTIASQRVRVSGSFSIDNPTTGTEATPAPTLTFSTATNGLSNPPVINCNPAGALQPGFSTTCSFEASWSDTQLTAAQTGTITVDPGGGGTPGTGQYSITGGTASTGTGPGACATLSDSFVITAGGTTVTSNVASYSTNLNGMQICDSNTYSYTVTFGNFDTALCGTPITAVNTATLAITGDPAPKSQSQTLTISLTGCVGGAVTIGGIKTTVINSYTWALTKTGGGGSLTVDPANELPIPFTITATQNAPTTVGYVAGQVSVQNTVNSPATISAVTVTVAGQAPQTIAVSSCQTASLPAQGTTSCSFNVSNPAAPAAGSLTASVTLSGSSTPIVSAAQAFDYQTAETFNIGGTANIFDTVNTNSLSSVLGQITGVSTTLVRFEPADQHPPSAAPGLTIDGSRTFTYNMIIARLGSCANSLTVSNTASLTPGGGSAQGTLTATASATFSVLGCNVLPSLSLSNVQQWAAVTWSWQMQKTAIPNQYQFGPNEGGTANYQVALTRTRQTGNYWLSGTLRITNPANFPLYISTVSFVGSSGNWGQPTNCLGGSNVGATAGPVGVGVGGVVPASGLSGRFLLAAGAQIDCVFNISSGSGAPPQGTVYAMATTSTAVIGSAGNVAQTDPFPVNFASPTQQWDIGGCVMFSDTATTQGSAGLWLPQMTGLPQQQQICDSRTWTYTGQITPVPGTGAICNQPVTITNNAQAMPVGGGSTVTSSATIQVSAINCLVPSPSPVIPRPQPLPSPQVPQSLQPLVVTVNPGVAAASSGDYVWAVAISSSAGASIKMPYSDNQQVQYTVSATRNEPTATNTVTGQVTVANPNTLPVSANSVSVTLAGSATPVAATCPSALPAVIPAGGNIVCSFSATVASTDPGTVSASAASTAGPSSTTQTVPYSFPAASTAGSQGRCAVISDQIAPLPILTATSFAVAQNRPAGNQISVCATTSYTFTAIFGPFTKNDCGVQTITATATATPTDGPQQSNPPTAQSTFSLEIGGCQSVLATDEVSVIVNQPVVSSSSSSIWKGSGAPDTFSTKIRYDKTADLKYNLTWDLVQEVSSSLSGTIVINNPTAAGVNVTSVRVAPELTGAQGVSGSIPVVEATCPDKTIGPKDSVKCTYTTAKFKGSGSGVVAAEATVVTGTSPSKRVQSNDTPFTTKQPAVQQQQESCAEVMTGLMMGTALLMPGGAKAIKYNLTRVCQSGGTTVTQPVGPFPDTACGKYTVASVMRIRPLNGRPNIQDAFAVVDIAQVQVTGCPLSETPMPQANIASQIAPSNVVTYGWKAGISSNASDPLEVQYNQPKVVVLTASVQRLQGLKSASVQGSVQLQSQGKSSLSVYKVQAAGMARTGELVIVNATCPTGNMANGMVNIPVLPGKVLCPFEINNLPPMDGPVIALVYPNRRAQIPLPTDPGVYRMAGAPKVVQGECVQVGTSRSLTKAGAVSAVPGQPVRSGAGLPTTPICRTSSANATFTFGPFKSTECGKYVFSADASADLTNSPAWANADLELNVNVVGCS